MKKQRKPPQMTPMFATVNEDSLEPKTPEEALEQNKRLKHRVSELETANRIEARSGLFTAEAFEELGGHVFGVLKSNQPRGIVSIDANGLKLINDTMGHKKGDELIAKFAVILENTFPYPSFIGRLGGDEFSIITVDLSEQDIRERMDSLRNRIYFEIENDNRIYVRFAYGISQEDGSKSFSDMKSESDGAMYENKKDLKAQGITTQVFGKTERPLDIVPYLG